MAKTKARPKRSRPAAGYGALASRIIQSWGGAGGEVALDRIVSEFQDVPRYDVVAALKELEKAGAGEFLVSKGERRSRFVWAARGPALAAPRPGTPVQRASPAAKNATSRAAAEPVPSPQGEAGKLATSAAGPVRALDHVCYVRPGFATTLRLPEDVTAAEVERLCRFLQAIPFANERGSKAP